MQKIEAIKPGPKPKTEEGNDDRRRRVDAPNQPKHPDLNRINRTTKSEEDVRKPANCGFAL